MRHPKKNLRDARVDQRIAFFDTLEVKNISSITDNLLETLQLSVEVHLPLREALDKFLLDVYTDVIHLNSVHSLEEYYEACKRRYSDVSHLCSFLLTADDDGVQVNRVNKNDEHLIFLIGKKNRKICLRIGDDNYYLNQKNPGSYKTLFRIIPELVEIANTLVGNDLLSEDEYKLHLKAISLSITSIAKIYEDIRGGELYQVEQHNNAVSRFSQTHHLDESNEFFKLFQEFKSDIDQYRDNWRLAPLYIRDILRAIPKELEPFRYEDFHISFKKTGTSYNHKSLPGIYASIIETDHVDSDDELIGYKSHYNTDMHPLSMQLNRKTIMIKQHKLDLRVIHMASNPIQDRANYYHNRLMKFLNQIRSDCTVNQGKGITFAQLVTSPKYRIREKNNVYCLDISKATDTLNKRFQIDCLEIIFGRKHAENWDRIISGSHFFVRNNKIISTFEQQCGQPQGYKSSFPSFAWVHHVIMRLVMLKHGLRETNPTDFYRVLGDDSIISCYDPNREILNSYCNASNFINWKIHLSKGYITNYDDDCAFAEFAKVRVLNGDIMTPIPIRLLMNSINSPTDYICYQWWLTKFYAPIYAIRLVKNMESRFPALIDNNRAYTLLFLNEVGISIFYDFLPSPDSLNLTDQEQTLIYLAYIKSKIKQTLLHQFIPDVLLTESDTEKYRVVTPYLDSHLESLLLNEIQDSEHKYVQILDRNMDIINALDRVFNSHAINIGVASLALSDNEIDTIISTCDMLLNLEDYSLIPTLDYCYKLVSAAMKILDRYNMRSDIGSAKNTAQLLENYHVNITQYLRILHSGQIEDDCQD